MSSEYHILPQIRDFLKSNGCKFLSKHVENMSYHNFVTTPSWNLACWGASLECIRNHAKLAYEAYQARGRIGFVGMERDKDALCRGRSRKNESWAAPAASPKPVPKPVDEPVRKSRAQVLGDRCCGAPRRDRIAAYKPLGAHRVAREASPDNVYRTKAY